MTDIIYVKPIPVNSAMQIVDRMDIASPEWTFQSGTGAGFRPKTERVLHAREHRGLLDDRAPIHGVFRGLRFGGSGRVIRPSLYSPATGHVLRRLYRNQEYSGKK